MREFSIPPKFVNLKEISPERFQGNIDDAHSMNLLVAVWEETSMFDLSADQCNHRTKIKALADVWIHWKGWVMKDVDENGEKIKIESPRMATPTEMEHAWMY